MLFDALDELSNHSHHRKENAKLIKIMEARLEKEKLIIRLIGIAIIAITVLIIFSK